MKTRDTAAGKRFSVTVLAFDRNPDGSPNPDPNRATVAEVFNNLSANKDDPRFADDIIGDEKRGSLLIKVKSNGDPSDALVVPISAGTETLPTDPDDINLDPQKKLVTDAAAADTVLDQVDLFNLLCVPGLTESAAQGQLSAFCKYRRAMLIADCRSDDQINGLQTGPPPVTEPRHASFYFPWLKAADDLAQGRITDFPPCGYMAGLYARTDSSRGVWKAPAGLRLNIGAFMHDLFRQGAFQGRTPRDAYFVKCDKETTPQNDINRGIVNILVGFAPLKPAEFVVIQLTQIAGQIET